MRALAAILLALLATPALAVDVADAEYYARALAIDSFDTSLSAVEAQDKYNLEEYGFTEISVDGDTVTFTRPDQSWRFVITILDTYSDQGMACITDEAMDGSYRKVQAVEFVAGDGAYYFGMGEVDHPGCIETD